MGTQWVFDENFEQRSTEFSIGHLPSLTEKFPIRDLLIYPAQFANGDDVNAIRRRGKMFWKCRHRRYVCYKDTIQDGAHIMVRHHLKRLA